MISRALEDPTQRWPESLTPILRNWYDLSNQLMGLLETATPNSIMSCELTLALLQPNEIQCRSLIEQYTQTYHSTIEKLTRPVVQTVRAIDCEVSTILKSVEPGLNLENRRRSRLLDLCRELARQLSELRKLESIGDEVE